jgi:hypothetical protein
VLARIAAHMQNARQMKQARSALDAFGQATVAVRASDGKLVWQTPLARTLLKDYFANPEDVAPNDCWLDRRRRRARATAAKPPPC